MFFFDFFRDARSRLIDFEVRREVASSQVPRIVIRSAFSEHSGGAAGAAGAAESMSWAAARSLPPHAPGVRMTVVKQTPSNYVIYDFIMTAVLLQRNNHDDCAGTTQ